MYSRIPAGVVTIVAAVMVVGHAAAGEWETDYAKAVSNATKTGRYLLLDFSGSDWCGWCMKLDKEVFSQPEFKKFAKEKLVCVLLDFPRAKHQSKKLQKQNSELAEKHGVRGYPTVILLSPQEELVGRTGYQPGGPEKYVEHLQTMIEAYEQKHPRKPAAKAPAAPEPPAKGNP